MLETPQPPRPPGQPSGLPCGQPSGQPPVRPPANAFGKFTFWFQWVTPLITASMFVFGRGIFFGQELGWAMLLLGVFVAPIWIIVHLVCAALTFIPKYPRRALALPTASGILNLATIPLTVVFSMFIEDATDSPDATGYESFASRVFGLSSDATGTAAVVSFFLVALCFIAYVVMAFIPPRSVRVQQPVSFNHP